MMMNGIGARLSFVRARSRVARVLGLGCLVLGLAGCGSPNFFEVTITVQMTPGLTNSCLSVLGSCEVEVSGNSYPLGNNVCNTGRPPPVPYQITSFQYGVDSDSGTVTFNVTLKDANGVVLGTGSAMGTVKKGRQALTVPVAPNVAAFPRGC